MNASLRPATRDDLKPRAELLCFLATSIVHITLESRADDQGRSFTEGAERAESFDGPGWYTERPIWGHVNRVAESSLFEGIDAGRVFVIEQVFHGIDATPDPKDAVVFATTCRPETAPSHSITTTTTPTTTALTTAISGTQR